MAWLTLLPPVMQTLLSCLSCEPVRGACTASCLGVGCGWPEWSGNAAVCCKLSGMESHWKAALSFPAPIGIFTTHWCLLTPRREGKNERPKWDTWLAHNLSPRHSGSLVSCLSLTYGFSLTTVAENVITMSIIVSEVEPKWEINSFDWHNWIQSIVISRLITRSILTSATARPAAPELRLWEGASPPLRCRVRTLPV